MQGVVSTTTKTLDELREQLKAQDEQFEELKSALEVLPPNVNFPAELLKEIEEATEIQLPHATTTIMPMFGIRA